MEPGVRRRTKRVCVWWLPAEVVYDVRPDFQSQVSFGSRRTGNDGKGDCERGTLFALSYRVGCSCFSHGELEVKYVGEPGRSRRNVVV